MRVKMLVPLRVAAPMLTMVQLRAMMRVALRVLARALMLLQVAVVYVAPTMATAGAMCDTALLATTI